jgi:hypothetical protein
MLIHLRALVPVSGDVGGIERGLVQMCNQDARTEAVYAPSRFLTPLQELDS